MPPDYLHNHEEFSALIRIVAAQRSIDPFLAEKDYWLMHVLYGLQKLGKTFELKGGTSLSKGFGIISRFSEDLDLCIHPEKGGDIPTRRNQDSAAQRAKRKAFFDDLAPNLPIDGITTVARDTEFDDIPKYRSGGIRLHYPSIGQPVEGLSEGILLEPGFDKTAPNMPKDISSWAYDYAVGKVEITDNRAQAVRCYDPRYTFVEKLQTISSKFRKQQEEKTSPKPFTRHYYDVYWLLKRQDIQQFIGTKPYLNHKRAKFGRANDPDITKNPAFSLSDPETRRQYEAAYQDTAPIYFEKQPSFAEILTEIATNAYRL